MAGPRNNLSWHSPAVRYRVYALHYRGASSAQIVADPDVAESIRKTGYKLHPAGLSRVWRSKEYLQYVEQQRQQYAAVTGDQMTQHVLSDIGALDTVTDVARYELARSIRELITAGPLDDDENPVERIKALTQSLATVSRDECRELKVENAVLRQRIAALEAALANPVNGTQKGAGLTPETIQKIEEQAGLM